MWEGIGIHSKRGMEIKVYGEGGRCMEIEVYGEGGRCMEIEVCGEWHS